jgi:molybdopterin synthase catalytic subunit
LDAVKWLIDELKATVPIWKKEFFEDGEVWKENSEQRLKPSKNRGYAKAYTN